jgi:dTDP-4-dehydrorhamnose reductase
MKVLFTGASGLLGIACRNVFEQAGIGFSSLRRELAWHMVRTHQGSELADADILVHAAANTNVEQCELEPDACYRDNFLLTEGLAIVCANVGIPLVFISSTGVYGEGEDTPYREYSDVRPTTHHHRAKWLGEQAVLAAAKSNMVIRTGWLFGGPFENPKNFVARRLEEAVKLSATSTPLFSNSEQRGCPTYTGDVADRLLLLMRKRYQGVFNIVNEGNASRLDYVRAILESAGNDLPVEPTSAAAFNRRAKVSANEMALNWRANELGLPAMPNWRSSLNSYIRRHYKSTEIPKNDQ